MWQILNGSIIETLVKAAVGAKATPAEDAVYQTTSDSFT
jgi:hypothetical protein